MVRRYAHLTAAYLMAYAGNMESHGTNTAHQRISAAQPDCKCLENKKFDVARGGIEPPTRGFSVRCSTN
jgi:hypothetical protein